jgi:hypothetical protein
MEIGKIIELMKEPEKLVDPRQINVMSGYLNGFITDGEEELNERNYQVSVKWAELRKELKSNAEADRAIELTDEYREREKLKLRIGRLRRFRADLRDRFEVLTKYH